MAEKSLEEVAEGCIKAARAHKRKREEAERKLLEAKREIENLTQKLMTADALFKDLLESTQSIDRENDELRARNQELREENERMAAELERWSSGDRVRPNPVGEKSPLNTDMFKDYADALNTSRILQDDNLALVRRAQQAEERVKNLVEENGRLNNTIAKNQQRIRALEKSVSDLTNGQAFRYDLGGGLGRPRVPQPMFSAEEVTALIKMTHPDRWAANPDMMQQANELTAKLLKMRKS